MFRRAAGWCSSEGGQRALCAAAVFVLMTLPPGLGAAGCCCRNHHHHDSSSGRDSSAASSEEDALASEDARIQRCVRTAVPGVLAAGGYENAARVDACAARGVDALAGGAAPPAAADAVASCIQAQGFPPAVAPIAADFVDCVRRALT
ncbi:CCR4-NOT transcription complex subunit 1 [Frankliniella fusca]|uniref:CCR4-NOT transcription complex subunit 1 n=1 Tax=Frankliniella fusca TaxID=407009 RepID=A0AAE1LQI8_9NEOP|nr:CCR4-NOT transcription complex subunit 1 [Frankliniella fusca]